MILKYNLNSHKLMNRLLNKKKIHYLSLSLIFSFYNTIALANQQCLSGNPSNNNILLQFERAKSNSSITQHILKTYQLNPTTEATVCTECSASDSVVGSGTPPVDAVADVAQQINGVPKIPNLLFKPECLEISNQFKSSENEISCPSGRKSSKNLCISPEIMSYQNAVITNIFSCFKKLGFQTLSPHKLFEMYSLESSFKPQYSYPGGTGLGQLTNIFVKDIHQSWRGGAFIKKLSENDSPECKAASEISRKDIKFKPSFANTCSFIEMGEGLERNILYSFIGIASSWENDLTSKDMSRFKNYIQQYSEDPNIEEVKNMILLNSYGPGGRRAGRFLANRLLKNSPEIFLKKINRPISIYGYKKKLIQTNAYTLKMSKRKNAIQNRLPENIKNQFEANGASACINL